MTEKEFIPGEIFIITDSKGKYIKPVIPGRLLSYVHVIYKSGANISSDFVEDFIKQVRRAQRPIVYIWFGTCELTEKSGKYIYIDLSIPTSRTCFDNIHRSQTKNIP